MAPAMRASLSPLAPSAPLTSPIMRWQSLAVCPLATAVAATDRKKVAAALPPFLITFLCLRGWVEGDLGDLGGREGCGSKGWWVSVCVGKRW